MHRGSTGHDLLLMPILTQSATFVGIVVGALNVCKYTPPAPPPCRRGIIFDSEPAEQV